MHAAELKGILNKNLKQVFYCGYVKKTKKILLVVKDKKAANEIKKIITTLPKDNFFSQRCQLKVLAGLKVERARSLEAMLSQLQFGTIIYDPTGIVERAAGLLNVAKNARQFFPTLRGCYFNAETRTIHFALSPKSKDISSLCQPIQNMLVNQFQAMEKRFACKVTLSYLPPVGKVIPIDAKSVVKNPFDINSWLNKLKWSLFIASASSALGFTAAKAQAISKTNGWLAGRAGSVHNNSGGTAGVVEGGYAQPFINQLGLQLRGYEGAYHGHNIWSIDGYIFWREPTMGLLGPHITYGTTAGRSQTLYGVHAEDYMSDLTLAGELGGQHQNTNGNGYYAEAFIHWYSHPNLDLNLGAGVERGNLIAQAGTEYQLALNSLPGLSLFADLGLDSHNLIYGMIGLRFYFGDNKALIQRHREDMVPPMLDLILLGKEKVTAPSVVS